MTTVERDHGGGLDAAIAKYGGTRTEWLDLSTGINPVPYPMPKLPADAWTALPDKGAFDRIILLARRFWNVPPEADILPTAGASAPIAALPRLKPAAQVRIPTPTYNEHAAAFNAAKWSVDERGTSAEALVVVHPNNPDGAIWTASQLNAPLTVIDESFCDVIPDQSHIALSSRPGTIVLKSFGKFWGLAGLRLGFAIGDPVLISGLRDLLGPWNVSGPALAIGAEALSDPKWSDDTRTRLESDAAKLDALMAAQGSPLVGGTSLFRTYQVADAKAAQTQLAKHKIWSRIFPYANDWLRLGLPAPDRWSQLEAAL